MRHSLLVPLLSLPRAGLGERGLGAAAEAELVVGVAGALLVEGCAGHLALGDIEAELGDRATESGVHHHGEFGLPGVGSASEGSDMRGWRGDG